MPLLVESLRAVNGVFDDIEPHLVRMKRSISQLFGTGLVPDLESALKNIDPPGEGLWKVRVLYDTHIRTIEAAPYEPKPYRSAVLIDGGSVSYEHKTADRPDLDSLLLRARNAGGDTALIVKDGRITDFSYANAAFFDGRDWWTPTHPLLLGTRRSRLLAAGSLKTADITVDNLPGYQMVSPINAMLDLAELTIDIDMIISET